MQRGGALRRARRGQGKLITPDGNVFEGAARGRAGGRVARAR
jgi:hypothetical protein